MNRQLIVILLMLFSFSIQAQETEEEKVSKIGSQIFLPSIEIGYLFNSADALSGGILTKTSLEYRIRNNNDIFFRVNYDQYSSDYTLNSTNTLTNVVEGTAAFTDLLAGGGYRFGDKKWRTFIMLQAGTRSYNFPEFVQNNNTVTISQGKQNIFNTRFTLGIEYYISEKSAFSFDLIQSQVWKEQDFWTDSGSAFGFSVGFLTALF